MIPFAFPPAEFYLFLLISLLAGVALLGWLVLLAFSGRMRQRARRHPWRSGIGFAVLMLLASFFIQFRYDMWRLEQEFAARRAALRVTLPQPQTLGGIAMPAGAKLVLTKENDLESYTEASFDTPVSAFGLQATRIERHLGSVFHPDTRKVIGQRAHTIHAWGPGVQDIEDWTCDASQQVEFRVPDGETQPLFNSCTLAAGNQADGVDLPAGTTVQARDGEHYTNGHVEPLRWFVTVNGEDPVTVRGLLLGRPGLKLDEHRRLVGVGGTAELACPRRLGPMNYPAGTLVQTLRYPMNRQAPDAWVFSPANGDTARRDDGNDVPDGSSVVQQPDGTVLDVVPNGQAGVIRYATIVMEDSQLPKPIRCPQ